VKKITVLCILCCFFAACKNPTKTKLKQAECKITYMTTKYDSFNLIPVDDNIYTTGDTVTVLPLTRYFDMCDGNTHVNFDYWYDGTKTYNPGDKFAITHDTILYVKWNEEHCSGSCTEVANHMTCVECTSDSQCAGRSDGKTVCGCFLSCDYPDPSVIR